MNMRDAFERIMREQREIALATTTDGLPHVRIVNFYYAPEEHRIYFATFKDNEKVIELAANPNTAFTTVPHNDTVEHVRASGRAVKSAHTVYDLAPLFAAKIPRYQETIDEVGDDLILYEIAFDAAVVTVDMRHIEHIRL
ncbi:pyridoxamine 5'-phosphate oxidase family protein [Selenomonas dianae]|uniref:Pyridoxamine 5'-phosphate oxidase-like domain-containing protein n=1 Tax=Selenomonas dianae TaxID=135079 RepID=A0ABP3CX29_9FIRM|nr:pyridoxamine 5'-phosphate oxidase family protein [Selenomonas dianae]WLD82661.1 pyridoxamine 5'-phosphate oxidase family protein [Selenomonas dianae]